MIAKEMSPATKNEKKSKERVIIHDTKISDLLGRERHDRLERFVRESI